jgi:catechol 2,3-dioxygenase-like lactoylglutathione lyase family enzyme
MERGSLMKKLAAIVFAAAVLLGVAGSSRAQLAPPNDMGVSMGHVHLLVRDVDASKKFWTDLGGIALKLGPNDMIKFPNGVIGLRKGDPTMNGTGGVNHFGFQVKSGAGLMEKLAAMGLKTEPTKGGCAASEVQSCGFAFTPEGVKIEFIEKPANTIPIRFDHIHFDAVGAEPDGANAATAMREWYEKVFGGTEGQSGAGHSLAKAVDLPGVSLRFRSVATVTLGTMGTGIDHIGFEVKNLEDFCKKAEAKGIKFDVPFTKRPDLGITQAFVTDPWGNYIELTDGLSGL